MMAKIMTKTDDAIRKVAAVMVATGRITIVAEIDVQYSLGGANVYIFPVPLQYTVSSADASLLPNGVLIGSSAFARFADTERHTGPIITRNGVGGLQKEREMVVMSPLPYGR